MEFKIKIKSVFFLLFFSEILCSENFQLSEKRMNVAFNELDMSWSDTFERYASNYGFNNNIRNGDSRNYFVENLVKKFVLKESSDIIVTKLESEIEELRSQNVELKSQNAKNELRYNELCNYMEIIKNDIESLKNVSSKNNSTSQNGIATSKNYNHHFVSDENQTLVLQKEVKKLQKYLCMAIAVFLAKEIVNVFINNILKPKKKCINNKKKVVSNKKKG